MCQLTPSEPPLPQKLRLAGGESQNAQFPVVISEARHLPAKHGPQMVIGFIDKAAFERAYPLSGKKSVLSAPGAGRS